MATPELKSYNGGCKCGAFKFTVRTADLDHQPVMSCNCSFCNRDALYNIYPFKGDMDVHQGFDNLVVYKTGANLAHRFCKTCGSSVFTDAIDESGQPKDRFALNVRMIDDLDINKLTLNHYDGKSKPPHYALKNPIETEAIFPQPTKVENPEAHRGNCHCGAVVFSIRIPELTDGGIVSCNCSICARNGYLSVYPHGDDLLIERGEENLEEYRFASKKGAHRFCKTCGSSMFIGLGDYRPGYFGVNLRMIPDVDVKAYTYNYINGKAIPVPPEASV